MAGENTVYESDGKGLLVTLDATTLANQLIFADGWLGLTGGQGESGDVVAITIDDAEYQFSVPDALAVSKGDTLYIDTTDLAGNTPEDTAYSTTSGAGKIALCKATADKDISQGSGSHWVTGKSLLHVQGV